MTDEVPYLSYREAKRLYLQERSAGDPQWEKLSAAERLRYFYRAAPPPLPRCNGTE